MMGLFPRYREWVSLLILLVLAGCQQSPQQKLIGRWYNDDMSIRFREDGRVFLNSRSGRVEGRYEYTGTQASSAQSASQNLVLDVIRDGQQRRLYFDADFLGVDRLRLSDLTPKARRTTERAPEFAVLRRSEDAKTAVTASR